MGTPCSCRDGFHQPIEAARPRADAVPRREEPGQRAGVGRLHLAPQRREGALAQLAQDIGVAPLPLGAVGPEGAPQQQPGLLTAHQQVVDQRDRDPEPQRRLVRRERAVRPGPPAEQRPERVVDRLEEDVGQAGRRVGAERVAVTPASSLAMRRSSPATRTSAARRSATSASAASRASVEQRASSSVGVEVAEPAKEIVGGVDGAGPTALVEVLQLRLERGQCRGIDQLAQLVRPEQLGRSSRSRVSACARRSATARRPRR